jgi:hypothetical protein
MTNYSSHDWRKNTDDAVVMDEHGTIIRPVNELKVKFTDPKSLRVQEVDVSRLIRVFCNNRESHRRSVKWILAYLCLWHYQCT